MGLRDGLGELQFDVFNVLTSIENEEIGSYE